VKKLSHSPLFVSFGTHTPAAQQKMNSASDPKQRWQPLCFVMRHDEENI
jgi:hypothetical protein